MAALEDVSGFVASLNRVAGDEGLDPADRVAQLRRMRMKIISLKQSGRASLRDCDDLLGQADTYIGSLELRREAGAMEHIFDRAGAREDADVRDMLVAQGIASGEDLDRVGWPSHDALDQAEEDGTLLPRVTTVTESPDDADGGST